MKTVKIKLENIHQSDTWGDLAYELKFDKFRQNHTNLDEDELTDLFYDEIISTKFKYGDYANIEIEVDENFNIIGGKIL